MLNFIKNTWLYGRLKSWYFTNAVKKEKSPYVPSYNMYWYPPLVELKSIFQSKLSQSGLVFVQIGSNDGVTGDPLHGFIYTFGWKGILIEPVQSNFSRLQQTHLGNNNLILLNNAVGEVKTVLKFYKMKEVDFPGKPWWYDQLGSFNKEVILAHSDQLPNVSELIEETEVETVTIADLYQQYALKHVDLFHIDTEGYDYEILKTIDMASDKPDFILFEHHHLRIADYKKAVDMLKENGYRICRDEKDSFAYLR